jgi:hypothetical protein
MELEKFKDYVKSKKKTDYKPFLDWLKSQMNLNKKELTFLRRGGSGRNAHSEQFGYNIKGKLKAFDLDDNKIFNNVNYDTKNVIKEYNLNK